MSQEANIVKCPNCGSELDVNDILYHQLDEELRQKYNDELAKEQKKFPEARRTRLANEDATRDGTYTYRQAMTTTPPVFRRRTIRLWSIC